jgi:hypothetical protein
MGEGGGVRSEDAGVMSARLGSRALVSDTIGVYLMKRQSADYTD